MTNPSAHFVPFMRLATFLTQLLYSLIRLHLLYSCAHDRGKFTRPLQRQMVIASIHLDVLGPELVSQQLNTICWHNLTMFAA
jgi:hypothetical protein